MTKVIIVDKAARARAPMAMQMFKKHAPNLEVIVRCLIDVHGEPMQDDTLYALHELGYPLHSYASTQLKKDDLDSLTKRDFMFSFAERYLKYINDIKSGGYRLYLLSEYAEKGKKDVPDPNELIRIPITLKYQEYYKVTLPPLWANKFFLQIFGKYDSRDLEGRRKLYLSIGRQIEDYVQGAVARMQREGIQTS